MVNTILRVQNGLELSPVLQKNLAVVLGEFEQTSFEPLASDAPFDFSQPYQQRINSVLNAFDFLIAHAPNDSISREKMRGLCTWMRQSYQLQPHTEQAIANKALEECLALLVDALEHAFSLSQDDAIERLNLAEQYYLLQVGRPNQATLSVVNGLVNTPTVLQLDTRMAPLHPQTKTELVAIKAHGRPKDIPTEFLALPSSLQLYLLTTRNHTLSDFKIDLGRLQTLCIQLQRDYLGQQAAMPYLDEDNPSWFETLEPASNKSLFIELYKQNNGDLEAIYRSLANFNRRLATLESPFSPPVLTQLRKQPLWYYRLSDWERNFVWGVLQNKDIDTCDQWYFPSRLRSGIPALANAGTHQLFKIEGDEIIALTRARKRTAHLVSRDLTRSAYAIQQEHCDRNLALVLGDGETPLFVGTLISPVTLPFSARFIPDLYLQNTLNATIRGLVGRSGATIHATNHMVNIAKEYYPTTATSPSCSSFLAFAKRELSQQVSPSTHPAATLIEYYETLLHTAPEWFSLRELMLAVQEHLIAHSLGMTVHGTCVSCKDRYALLLMLSDSMALIYDATQQWPEYGKKNDDAALRSVFLDLLQSRHQIEEANYGAPGSYGIKTLDRYLPEDYVHAIHSWVLNEVAQDIMASSNELKKIPLGTCPKGFAHALMEAQTVPEALRVSLFQQMKRHFPASLQDKLPKYFSLPQDSSEARASIHWLAHLFNQKDIAVYLRWIISAQTVPEKDIRALLNHIHRVSQQDNWDTVSVIRFLGMHSPSIPEGIQQIRRVMTHFQEGSASPLGILSKVVFIANAQLRLSGNAWLRDEKTTRFYNQLNNFLLKSPVSDHWSDNCDGIVAMLECKGHRLSSI